MLTFISEGFPEFARFFNHSHLWKLQSIITAECSAIELLRKMRPCARAMTAYAGRVEIFIADGQLERQAGALRGMGGRHGDPGELAREREVREYL